MKNSAPKSATANLLAAALIAPSFWAFATPASAQDVKDPLEPAVAIDAAEPGDPGSAVNLGNVSLQLTATVTSQYWFRGIGQENQGFILQPGADVSVKLFGDAERGITVDGFIGTWSSIHDHNTLNIDGAHQWYEHDFIAGVAIGLPHGLGLDISYINLYSPAAGDIFAEEIDVSLTFDDGPLLRQLGVENISLNPSITIAIETDGGSDAGDDQGVYGEIAISPTVYTIESNNYPISLSVPVILGLSIDDYYENSSGDDDFFGYLEFGVDASVPLPFVPEEYGAWSANAGIHGIILGDTAQDISEAFGTGDDTFNVFGMIGITATY